MINLPLDSIKTNHSQIELAPNASDIQGINKKIRWLLSLTWKAQGT